MANLDQFPPFCRVLPVLACVKHARLYRVLGNANDLSHLLHRFLVIVDEIDDLAVVGGKARRGIFAIFRLYRASRRQVRHDPRFLDRLRRLLVQSVLSPLAQERQRLEPRDRDEPSRNGASAFKPARLAPDIQEHVPDDVFRRHLVTQQAKHEAVDPHMVPREQYLHCQPVTAGNATDQRFVCRCLHRHRFGSRICRRSRRRGSIPVAGFAATRHSGEKTNSLAVSDL